ncbi:MAG: hypothetical protein HY985_03720 [Magnetospirillum sp.]|nr:hypothetical protein [Magnetospirillum sp.]
MTETNDTPAESAPPAVAETETPRPARGSWRATAIVVLFLVAALGVAGMLVWPQVRGMLKAPTPVAAVDPMDLLRAELTAPRERLQQLESRLDTERAAALPPPDVAGLEDRIAVMEQSVRALESQPKPAKLQETVDAVAKEVAEVKRTAADAAAVLRLADRIEKTEATVRDFESHRSSAATLLLAVGQLREAVNAALPFDAELRALAVLAGDHGSVAEALAGLKPRAAAGIPTRLTLNERFGRLVPEMVRADVLPAERTWWRETLRRLATLVVVRREDGAAEGANAAAIAARTQARLTEADLAGAIAEIEGLSAGAAEAARPWLDDARARLAADKALSELTAQVVASVGGRP